MSNEKVLHADLDALVNAAVDDELLKHPELPDQMAGEMIASMFGEQMAHHPATQELRAQIAANVDVRGMLTRRIMAEACAQLNQDPQMQAQLDKMRTFLDALVAEEEP